MKKRSLHAFLLVLLTFMISCKGDDEPEQPDKSSLLTQNDWVYESIQIDPPLQTSDQNGDSITVSELYPYLQDCKKDDRLALKSDNRFTYSEGETKCDTGDPQIYQEGSWEFNKGEDAIFFSPETPQMLTPYKRDILQLTDKQLILQQVVQSGSKPQTLTIVYRAAQ